MGTIIPPTSPWRYIDFTDYQGNHIWLDVTFNGTWTAATTLTGATVHRDSACVFTKVIIGAINPDGSLPAGTKIVNVPAGDTSVTKGQLNANGLATIGDLVNAPQVTASQ